MSELKTLGDKQLIQKQERRLEEGLTSECEFESAES